MNESQNTTRVVQLVQELTEIQSETDSQKKLFNSLFKRVEELKKNLVLRRKKREQWVKTESNNRLKAVKAMLDEVEKDSCHKEYLSCTVTQEKLEEFWNEHLQLYDAEINKGKLIIVSIFF